MDPSSRGVEVIADLYGVDKQLLKDEHQLNNIFSVSLKECGFTILDNSSHKFEDGGEGVTGLFLLSESHATYHSYPEWNTIAINVFSCGIHNPQAALDLIIEKLSPETIKSTAIKREFLIQEHLNNPDKDLCKSD